MNISKIPVSSPFSVTDTSKYLHVANITGSDLKKKKVFCTPGKLHWKLHRLWRNLPWVCLSFRSILGLCLVMKYPFIF